MPSGNSREYRTLMSANSKLTQVVKDKITLLGAELLSRNLITTDSYVELRNTDHSPYKRVDHLVALITDKAEQDPRHFYTFVEILDEDRATFGSVLKFLELTDNPAPTTTISGIKLDLLEPPWHTLHATSVDIAFCYEHTVGTAAQYT